MPIPETPYTREEAYLNAIATGDSGGIPETPYTREEMYLDAIARNGGGGGGSSMLSGLTDVDISNPTDGQTLVYDAASSKWVNGSGGGGGVFNINGTFADEVITLDKTYTEIKNAYLGGLTCIINAEVDQSDPEYIYRYSTNVSVAAVLVEDRGAPGDVTTVYVVQDSTNQTYITSSPSGYPDTTSGNT